MKSAVAFLVAQLVVAGLVVAQEVSPAPPAPAGTAEFSRASGGEIEAITKRTDRLSLSLGMTTSHSSQPFGGNRNGYEASAGGTVIADRLWFFGAAQTMPSLGLDRAPAARYGRLSAQLGDRHDFTASVAAPTLPSSLLSLKTTAIVSPNSTFTMSVTRSSSQSQPAFMRLAPAP